MTRRGPQRRATDDVRAREIKARAANPLIPQGHTGLREWAGG